jgi:nucleoside-diphosphate-sugar epimerase
MNIFVAGATGALGAQLVPRLVAAGHDVTGMTRSRPEAVRRLGARAVVADALDPDAVGRAIAEARPDVIVHQLTALAGSIDPRHFERDFAQTNRLRTAGPTTCSPPRVPPASSGSSRRATPAGRTRAAALP